MSDSDDCHSDSNSELTAQSSIHNDKSLDVVVRIQNEFKRTQAAASNFTFGFEGATKSRAAAVASSASTSSSVASGKSSESNRIRKKRVRSKANEPNQHGTGKGISGSEPQCGSNEKRARPASVALRMMPQTKSLLKH